MRVKEEQAGREGARAQFIDQSKIVKVCGCHLHIAALAALSISEGSAYPPSIFLLPLAWFHPSPFTPPP